MVKKEENKTYFVPITIVLVIASSAMIAHGLRMMVQGLFHPTSYYPAPLPSTLDFWFDWFLLFLLGTLVMSIAIKRWIRWYHQVQTH